ncbi:hypothetical protein ACH5RR_016475 [Cinchona calisaya]|uniref:Root cap n=1 Tax=Cinchona calisaya TaxID=153742 RepID=A0ABD2ZW29_9GENT
MALSSVSSMRFLGFWVISILFLCLPAILMAQRPRSPPPPARETPPPPPPPREPPPRTPPPGTPPPPKGRRTVRCRSPLFPRCFNIPFECPLDCPGTCLLDCAICRPDFNSSDPFAGCNFPGAICQDPRFVGGDGNTFYFHGRKDEDFCLVSDTSIHINGHFIGKRNPNLRRDFTWVQAIGIMFDNHKILVAAKKTPTWDDNVDRLSISLDGNPISLPTKEGEFSAPSNVISIKRTSSTNGIIVEVVDNFKVTANVVPITAEESKVHGYNITDEDCFAHLELGFKFFNLSDGVDGVLGQTYRSNYVSKIKVNVPMQVMSGAHKYWTSGLFSTDCAVSRFGANVVKNVGSSFHQHAMHCISGMQGNGLVCKK